MAVTTETPTPSGATVWDPGGAAKRPKFVGKLLKKAFRPVLGALASPRAPLVDPFSVVGKPFFNFTHHAWLQLHMPPEAPIPQYTSVCPRAPSWLLLNAPAAYRAVYLSTSVLSNSFGCPQKKIETQHAPLRDKMKGPRVRFAEYTYWKCPRVYYIAALFLFEVFFAS